MEKKCSKHIQTLVKFIFRKTKYVYIEKHHKYYKDKYFIANNMDNQISNFICTLILLSKI